MEDCMNKIKIIADSTCDLTDSILKKYEIGIIPLCVIMGDDTYYDGVDITPEEIYAWSEKENSTPKTAAPVLNDVINYLKPYVNEQYDIIFIGISENMSSTCNVVRLASDFLHTDCVHIIDSKNLSTGIGHQVLKAAQLATEGKSVEYIVDYIVNRMQVKVKASFVIDTLTYLHRGGRCSSVAALFGNALKLKPMIVVNNGSMGVSKKFRGTNRKVVLDYAKEMEVDLLHADQARVFITHSGCDDAIVNELYRYIENLNIFKEIIITTAGSVITCHCGPKTLGILYVEK
jgi:DegV family protein with EDD domain